jgi:hypothetical protein
MPSCAALIYERFLSAEFRWKIIPLLKTVQRQMLATDKAERRPEHFFGTIIRANLTMGTRSRNKRCQ